MNDAPTPVPTDTPIATSLPTEIAQPTTTPIATATSLATPSPVAERTQDIPLPLQGNDEIRNLLPGFSLGPQVFEGDLPTDQCGYSDEQIGLEVGVIELIFRDQASPAPTRLILGKNIREWLLGRGGAMPHGSELREVYRGDTNFQVAGVIDMLGSV